MERGTVEFTVSPTEQQIAENELIVEAIRAFNTRAKIISDAFSAQQHQLKELTVQTAGRNRGYYRTSMAMAAGVPAQVETPQFNEGMSTVMVTVSGAIELVK